MSPPLSDVLGEVVAAAAAEHRFSGAVRVEIGGEVVVDAAFGLADRAHGIANTPGTRFGTASAAKGFTALTVMRLVEDGVLSLDTPVRSVLGRDLALIDDRVTVEHLLSHRSGIGDYLDEEALESVTDYVLPLPVHRFDSVESYLPILDGHPQVSVPGERFAYNNGGYVVLAIVAQRAAGEPFADLVDGHVCRRAGLARTGFLRSDELPGDVALGYLSVEGLRTNALHLPVVGGGDGGMHTTTADVHALWRALYEGRVVAPATFTLMTTPRSTTESGRNRYGLGFWLAGEASPDPDAVELEGYDAGISFRSVHRPGRRITSTVVSNWSDGAWPICRAIDAAL